eukprot:TRINITY_DN8403_c0_g1_i3.p1 TRINITY_DN8403_c0_g1~~TRINITY_DN8403_c0_g1_i3.p1  ORF type:complete len:257 (-),score=55.25 TRINITY_DN8403_c0_g1_i3:372-1142(-)
MSFADTAGLLGSFSVPKALFMLWALFCCADLLSESLSKELLVALLFFAGFGACNCTARSRLIRTSEGKAAAQIVYAKAAYGPQYVPAKAGAQTVEDACLAARAAEDPEKAEELLFFRPRSVELSAQLPRPYERGPMLPDGCTSVVLKGVPTRYSPDRLCRRLLQGKANAAGINFVFLPPDPKKAGRNLGFAMVDFASPHDCLSFFREFHLADRAVKFPGATGSGACEVSAARLQGLTDNMQKHKSSRQQCFWVRLC